VSSLQESARVAGRFSFCRVLSSFTQKIPSLSPLNTIATPLPPRGGRAIAEWRHWPQRRPRAAL
jgi:hypothetical protein